MTATRGNHDMNLWQRTAGRLADLHGRVRRWFLRLQRFVPAPVMWLWIRSVWSRNGVKREDWRYRGQVRFAFPLIDLLFAYFGVVGITNGIGSVQDAAGHLLQIVWSSGITVSALLAFVGVGFPRLWALELVAKIVLVSLVSAYIALYISRGTTDPNITALGGLMVILIVFPFWRIGDLGFEGWLRGHGRSDGHRRGDDL